MSSDVGIASGTQKLPPGHCAAEQPSKIPILYGTAWKRERTADLVYQALTEGGFRGVDTAAQLKHYREDLVGEGLARALSKKLQRSDIWIQTKFSPNQDLDYPEDAQYAGLRVPFDRSRSIRTQVRQSIETSRQNLRVATLDSVVLHSPCKGDLEKCVEVWRALEEEVRTGRVRFLGLSNVYDEKFFADLLRQINLPEGNERSTEDDKNASAELPTRRVVPVAILQNRFARQYGFDRALRQICMERAIVYQPFWTLTANKDLLVSTEVKQLARAREVTVCQLWYAFVRWLGRRGGARPFEGVQILCGSCDLVHMREAVASVTDATRGGVAITFSDQELTMLTQLLHRIVEDNLGSAERAENFETGNKDIGLRFVSGRSSSDGGEKKKKKTRS